MTDDTAIFLGLPFQFKDLCTIYPPTIKAALSEPLYNNFLSAFIISQEEIDDLFKDKKESIPTPLEFILINSYHNKEFCEIIKKGFEFFTREKIEFIYEKKLILFGGFEGLKYVTDISQLRYLSEENFFDFQNAIRKCLGLKAAEMPDPDEDPRIRRIKAKARYRDKIKAKKGLGLSLQTSLASICCMDMGLNPLNIGEISYAALDVLMRTYQKKEKYDTEIRSLIGGADPKKIKPKYWISEDK